MTRLTIEILDSSFAQIQCPGMIKQSSDGKFRRSDKVVGASDKGHPLFSEYQHLIILGIGVKELKSHAP